MSTLRRKNERAQTNLPTVRRNKMSTNEEDPTIYKVVVNHEEQYSIWPAERENPLGWRDAGKTGLKEECLEYIKDVWTDMRPLSVRKKWKGYYKVVRDAN
jgi:MbtH protein